MAATETFIVSRVLRREDPKLLAGQATYIDNQSMAGMVWMHLVRPPFVHARDRISATVDSAAVDAPSAMLQTRTVFSPATDAASAPAPPARRHGVCRFASGRPLTGDDRVWSKD